MKSLLPAACLLGSLLASSVAAAETKPTAKQALQAFNDLIGEWRGTGEPLVGSRDDRLNNFWTETIRWEWQFKGDDAWLLAKIEKGKYFAGGELRYLPEKETYRLVLKTVGKETLTFEGKLDDQRLTLDRTDEGKKENQRFIFSLLHSNRYLFRYEVKGTDQKSYTAQYRVGATKEGKPFAGPGDDRPECVVSGGLGTIAVTHKGKTYYVCCSGCRDAFKEEPDKYIAEYEARKAKKKKEE
jgi:Archaeal TRASH domain